MELHPNFNIGYVAAGNNWGEPLFIGGAKSYHPVVKSNNKLTHENDSPIVRFEGMIFNMDLSKQYSDQFRKDSIKAPRQWLRHIFEHSPALICVTDYHGVFLDINEAGVKMLGGSATNEIIGKLSISSFYADPSDRRRFQSIVERDGYVQEFETRFQCMDIKVIDVRITGAARLNAKGDIIGYEAFILDVTDKRKAEQALKESEEKYRTVVENSLSAIVVHQEGRIKFANQSVADMLGFDKSEDLLNRYFWEFVHPEDRAIVKERGMMRERGQLTPERYTYRVIQKDKKTTKWVELRATHALYMGKPSAVTNFIDITESKKAEEEIRNLSQRLVKVREEERKMLAADLHDELGQILTTMHFGLDNLQKKIPSEFAQQRESCEELIRSVERMADVVRKTTSFLRPTLLDHMVLIPALKRYINEFKERRPDIHVDFKPLGFKKRLNPEIELVLYRIFQESLTNIVKHAQATKVEIILTYSHPHVILTFRDNGVGCSETHKKMKSKKGSEGIGLLSMRERVTSLGGSFEFYSAPGNGMTIRADIPV
jgi:PAS domain S-box-containing protein